MRITTGLLMLISAAIASATFTASLNQDARALLCKATRQAKTAVNVAGLRNRNLASAEVQNQLLDTLQAHTESVVNEISAAIEAGHNAAEQVVSLIHNALAQLQSLGANLATQGQQVLVDLFSGLLGKTGPTVHFERARLLLADLAFVALYKQTAAQYLQSLGLTEEQLQTVFGQVMESLNINPLVRGITSNLGNLASALSGLLSLAQSAAGNTFVAVQTMVQNFLATAASAGQGAVNAAATQLMNFLKPFQAVLGNINSQVENVINQFLETGRSANQKGLSDLANILSTLMGLIGATADNTHVAIHTLVRDFLNKMAAAGGMAVDAAGQLLLNFLAPFRWILGTIYDQVEDVVSSIIGGDGRTHQLGRSYRTEQKGLSDLTNILSTLIGLIGSTADNIHVAVHTLVRTFLNNMAAAGGMAMDAAGQLLLDALAPFRWILGTVYDAVEDAVYAIVGGGDKRQLVMPDIVPAHDLPGVLTNLLILSKIEPDNIFMEAIVVTSVIRTVENFVTMAVFDNLYSSNEAAAQALLDFITPSQTELGDLFELTVVITGLLYNGSTEVARLPLEKGIISPYRQLMNSQVENVISQFTGTGRSANQKGMSDLVNILSTLMGLIGATADNTHVAIHTLVRDFLNKMAAASGMAVDAAGQLLLTFLAPFRWILGTIYDQVENAVSAIIGGEDRIQKLGRSYRTQEKGLSDLTNILSTLIGLIGSTADNIHVAVHTLVRTFLNNMAAAGGMAMNAAGQLLLDALAPFRWILGTVYDAVEDAVYAIVGGGDGRQLVVPEIGTATDLPSILSTLLFLAKIEPDNVIGESIVALSVFRTVQNFVETAVASDLFSSNEAAAQALLEYIIPFQGQLGKMYDLTVGIAGSLYLPAELARLPLEKGIISSIASLANILSTLIGLAQSTAGNTHVAIHNVVQQFLGTAAGAGQAAVTVAAQTLVNFIKPFKNVLGSVYDQVVQSITDIIGESPQLEL